MLLPALPNRTAIFGHGLFSMTMLTLLENPKDSPKEIMEKSHDLLYNQHRNLRNGEILCIKTQDSQNWEWPQTP
jgi:hypothetical protein